MNEHKLLEKLLDQFREIAPPTGVRESNREAVQIALEQPLTTHWWQRSITLPLPMALATAAMLLVSLTAHMIGVPESGDLTEPENAPNSSGGTSMSAKTLASSFDSNIEYSETQSYLSGAGVIDRDIFYRIKE